jgi:hypothetical protein
VFSFALMDNHYHLLLQTPEPAAGPKKPCNPPRVAKTIEKLIRSLNN